MANVIDSEVEPRTSWPSPAFEPEH